MATSSYSSSRFLIPAVKALTVIGMLAAVLCVPVLWLVSGEVAVEAPEFAWLQWPYFVICVGLLVCVETIGVALWRLLSRVARGEIFDARGLVWVNAVVGAAFAAAFLFAVACAPVFFVTHGPPVLSFGLIAAVGASFGFALLMVVMRQLLVQATSLRDEMAEVI